MNLLLLCPTLLTPSCRNKVLRLKTPKCQWKRHHSVRLLVLENVSSSHQWCSIKINCSWKFRRIHRKAPALESVFNKVAGLKACNFIQKRLQHKCFPVNIAKVLKTPILKNICKQLLLTCGVLYEKQQVCFCFLFFSLTLNILHQPSEAVVLGFVV